MAEREGFEPSEPARVHLISNQARSAAPASLQKLLLYFIRQAIACSSLDLLRAPALRPSGHAAHVQI